LFEAAGFVVLARARDGLEARAAIREYKPDLAVLDVNMPGASGLELLREAREQHSKTRIVLVTAAIDPDPIAEALRLQVDGLVLKDAVGEVLLHCVREALSGRPWIDRTVINQIVRTFAPSASPVGELTAREKEVAHLVADGLRNKEIGQSLGIGEGTVKMHLHNLYQKLGIASRTELALMIRGLGPTRS
jgi:DNA-binding NarL/FixJ family response regulator